MDFQNKRAGIKDFIEHDLFVPITYFASVVISILFAFNFSGSINVVATLILLIITLPWSIISVPFVWALIHGAGLDFFTVLFLIFGGVNAFLLNLILNQCRKNH
jgi:hypothetical protein